MRKLSEVLILTGLILAVSHASFARTILVPDDYETIQTAIDAAENGDTVRVAPGEYSESVFINSKAVSLVGEPDDPASVVVDSRGNGSVITIFDVNESRIMVNGFTLLNGTGSESNLEGDMTYGGGLFIQRSRVATSNVYIDNCSAENGGGICGTDASDIILSNIHLNSTSATIGGSAIALRTGSNVVWNIGSIQNDQSIAASYGMLYLDDESMMSISHVLATNNSGGRFAGFFIAHGGDLILDHVTMVNNTWPAVTYVYLWGDVTASNSIFRNNGDNAFGWGNFCNSEGYAGGNGNIDADPRFLDPENGDFHLTSDSPCIDAGDPESEPDPDGTRTDIGAFYVHQTTHRIPLRHGWNLISSFNQPRNSTMPAVWNEVVNRNNLIVAKNQSGEFFLPNIFDGIGDWDVRQGYWVKMDWRDTLTIINVPTDVCTTIPLRQGWNLAAYFPEEELDVRDAFAGIFDDIILIKDMNGRFYRPSANYSNMSPLTRGRGYQVAVREACELIYPDGEMMVSDADGDASRGQPRRADRATADHGGSAVEETTHFQPIAMTGANMSLLISALIPAEAGIQSGEIGVFTEKGLCVGAGSLGGQASLPVRNRKSTHRGQAETPILLTGIAIWADDPTTPEIDGAVGGEPLSFRLWDGEEEMSIPHKWDGEDRHSCLSNCIVESQTRMSDLPVLIFETDGFAEVTLDVVARHAVPLPTALTLHSAFPNPFNSITTIRYSLPEASSVKLAVFDLSGREVATLATGYRLAGVHDVVWSADGVGSGLYFVRLDAGVKIMTQKVLLVK